MSPEQNKTILIVDNDEPTRNLLEAVMRRYGLPALVVPTAEAAIAALQAADFGCIILDLMMPAVGGDDVIAFLAAERRTIPVIVCTAAGQPAIERLDPAIVSAIIRKPFDIEELVMTVNALMSE